MGEPTGGVGGRRRGELQQLAVTLPPAGRGRRGEMVDLEGAPLHPAPVAVISGEADVRLQPAEQPVEDAHAVAQQAGVGGMVDSDGHDGRVHPHGLRGLDGAGGRTGDELVVQPPQRGPADPPEGVRDGRSRGRAR